MLRLLTMIAFLLPLLAAPTPVRAEGNAAMAGAYVLDRGQSDAVNRAIETAVSHLSFVTRPIARRRLRNTNQPYQRLVLAFGGGKISIAFDQRRPLVTPASGAQVDWIREDGEKLKISTEWESAVLEQTFRSDDGQRVNRFSLGADGKTLTVNVAVSSPRLPRPLTYKLVYTRAS